MKNILSFIACIFISLVLLQYRIANSDLNAGHQPLKITEWDAFGYYVYLPAIGIYHDYKELKWLGAIDEQYHVTGGNGWQAIKVENGNYVFKYLGGIALMQLPLFITAHYLAQLYGYPADGFSAPYQYTLGFGLLVYCLLALLLLRVVLLRFFSDLVTAVTLVMVCLATNFIQYAAVDNGQSHGYLFVLYAAVLYTTMKWHERPATGWAVLTGYIVGLATMSRPTEAIMVLIPLLWNTQDKTTAAAKWLLVRNNRKHIVCAAIAGLAGIAPQLIYWKLSTGSFVFDVGSKWDFLNPHFRVLLGWEKGWFIYTPVTLGFVAGLWLIRKFPFRKSVLWFGLLNIYIIIAWHEWRYGGSYATRALVQSYPVFALPFAALLTRLTQAKWRLPVYLVLGYLLCVNLFQTVQYCSTILHYDDMNRKYYGAIYLNPDPTPEDMSLLDNEELLTHEDQYRKAVLGDTSIPGQISFGANGSATLLEQSLSVNSETAAWIKIESRIKAPGCLWQSFMHASFASGKVTKDARVRLFSPISKDTATNTYALYVRIPADYHSGTVRVYLSSASDFRGSVERVRVTRFEK